MRTRDKNFNVRLTAAEWDRFETLAKKREISMSELVRQLVREESTRDANGETRTVNVPPDVAQWFRDVGMAAARAKEEPAKRKTKK